MTSQDSPTRVAGMPRTSTLPAPAPADHRGGRGVVLVLGVAVTAVSALALVALGGPLLFRSRLGVLLRMDEA